MPHLAAIVAEQAAPLDPNQVLTVELIIFGIIYLVLLWWVGGMPGRIATHRCHPAHDAINIAGYMIFLLGPVCVVVAILLGASQSWVVGPIAGAVAGGFTTVVLWLAVFVWAHSTPDLSQRRYAAAPTYHQPQQQDDGVADALADMRHAQDKRRCPPNPSPTSSAPPSPPPNAEV